MKIATHPGNFHADDVFAVAVLGLVHGPLELVRTRDEARLAAADVRVDIGGRSDPSTGDFDHHQRAGAGERANGIRYASFGLVWRAFGAGLAGSDEAAEAIDERLVQGVDANDTGQTISQPLVDSIRPMTVSGVIAAMNPAWDEELTPAQEDARFARGGRAGDDDPGARARRRRAPTGAGWSSCGRRSRVPPTRASSSSIASSRGTRRS